MNASEQTPSTTELQPEPNAAQERAEASADALPSAPPEAASQEVAASDADGMTLSDSASDADGTTAADAGGEGDSERPSRRKIEEQLEALKRKEVELRRALVMADHPELADSIRVLQGRTYALERVEAKLAVGLSKAELRRKETLQKQRAGLLEKRAELDAKIAEVDAELNAIGVERQQGYEQERRQCIEELMIALGTHDGALHAAGIEAIELVPELKHWLPEVEALAEQLSHKARSN